MARIQDIAKHEGQPVTIHGWLHNRRSSGKIHFLQVRDGSGFIQAVMSKAAVGDEVFKSADHLSQETSLSVSGTVRADARAPGGFEIDVTGIEVHGPSSDYPITPKEHGVDYLLDRRHLWIRSPRQQAILRVRHEVINAVRDYFNSRDFILCDTPIFTPAACEGTSTLFPVQYFEDTTAYLTQSGQLYNEANAMALGKVYCFGPTFRAEKSKTRRHLTEFWMVEPEMAYANLDDVIALAEGLVVEVVGRVLDRRRAELKVIERDTSKLEAVTGALPARDLRRSGEDPDGQGAALRVRRRPWRDRRDRPLRAVRSSGVRDALSGGGEGVLHEAGRRAAGQGLVRRRARAGGLRRDHRRRPAHRRLRPAGAADQGAQPAARSLRVVPGSPPLRLGPPRRLRHGHRARRLLDLRPRARARDDSLSEDALSDCTPRAAGYRLQPAGPSGSEARQRQ